MKIENNKVKVVSPFDGDVAVDIAEFELKEGCFTWCGFSLPVDNYPELKAAWQALYPNGKPTPEVPQTTPLITDDQKAIDMMKYLMQSDQFLTTVGITPMSTVINQTPTA